MDPLFGSLNGNAWSDISSRQYLEKISFES